VALSLVFTLGIAATPALGWANGPATPAGSTNRDGYGTHDYIIDQAMKVVAGRNSGWLDVRVARLTSDDPDTCGCSVPLNHVYREKGQRGGAIHMITESYARAQSYYNKGKAAAAAGDSVGAAAHYRNASKQVGLMAHYYGDILMPWHANYAAVGETVSHENYERIVDSKHRKASDSPAWSSSRRTVSTVTNVRTKALSAAAYSRTYYGELYSLFIKNQTVLTARVSEITGFMLKRAANDLADIIYSIPLGVGNPPPVAKLASSVRWVYPRVNEPYQVVYVTATDTNGRTVEGVAVDVAWPNPSVTGSPTTIRIYTDPIGKSHWTRTVGASPLMVKRTVGLKSTNNGKTATGSTWFMTTPKLGYSTDGFKTTASTYAPKVGQSVTVSSIAKDTAGKPVAGLPVTWTWQYSSGYVTTSGVTNSSGIATSTRAVTSTTQTTKVTVTARVQSGSENRSSTTGFTRQ
jgi:hypothetical protein